MSQEGSSSEDIERVIWESMRPAAWHNSVAKKESVFYDTYKATRFEIEQVAIQGGHDVIIEVGCGTGDVIGELRTEIPHYGLDINQEFVDFCRNNHEHCTFVVQDATTMIDWWKEHCEGKYKKPLVTCVNNTLNIMPGAIRGQVVDQMLAIAGHQGRCLVTYWNGNFFSHAIMSYYRKNQDLCGPFRLKHVNWDNRVLVTPSGYSTEWHTVPEVQEILRACNVDVKNASDTVLELDDDDSDRRATLLGKDHIHCAGLAIFAWFSQASSME